MKSGFFGGALEQGKQIQFGARVQLTNQKWLVEQLVSMVLMAVTFGGKWFCEVVTQSIDSEAYINCLKNMHQKFSHQANPLSWKNSILIHDNARPRISVKTNEFLQ